MQESPVIYAQKIIDLLAGVSYSNADTALKIARNLLDYKITAVPESDGPFSEESPAELVA